MGSRLRTRLRAGGFGSSDLRSLLFPTGTEAGLLLDPSDGATGFQNASGTTAGVLDQPTGLRLDKRLNLALGSELITVAANRDFSSDTGFWTKDAGVTLSGDAMNWAATAANFAFYRSGLATAGKYYEVTWTITSISAGGLAVYAGNAAAIGPTRNAPGTYTDRVVMGTANLLVGIASVGASTTGSVGDISIKEVTGNHVLQATSAARPTWKLNGAIYSDLMDGTDDGYATPTVAAGTFINGMDCFLAIKRNSVAKGLPFYGDGASKFFGVWDSAAATVPDSGAGTPTYLVNGVGVTAARDALNTAMPNGTWVVLEVRGLDLSAWTLFGMSNYGGGFNVNADIGLVALCPTQSAANRARARTLIGAKVGLSL